MISKAIFDSGVFIGSQYAKDQYGIEALKILENFKERVIGKVYTTNFVLAESVNFLLTKAGFQRANEMLIYLTETDNIEVIVVNNVEIIKEIFQKYKNLSITDCSLIVISEKLKINKIFSFDRHFDSVKGITRLTSI